MNLESFWRCRNTKIIRKHSSKPPKFSRLRRAILSTVLYPQINRGTQCRSTYKILLTLVARSYTWENSDRPRPVHRSFCE